MIKQIIERFNAPTPKFWQKVRNIALGTATVAGAVLVAPVAIPATIITVSTYLAWASGIVVTLSTLTSTEHGKLNN